MRTAIIAGASGLVGTELLRKLIDSDHYRLIYILTRKSSGILHEKIKEFVIDFELIGQLEFNEPIDDVFCTLGTTLKKAGSREKFKKVDYGYVVTLASMGKRCRASQFLVVSSMGANPDSSIFYNQVKGMTEQALISMKFEQLVIVRPSILLGERSEVRPAERLSAIFMKALNFLIPYNYKAISAEKVADSMLNLALRPTGSVRIVKSGEMLRG